MMRNAFLNKKWLNFSETEFLTKNGVRPSKRLVWTPNVEKIQVRKKEVFLKLQCMPNAFLNKKWLNFSKTEFLTKNGVRPSKRLVWTPTVEKIQVRTKEVFLKLQCMPNAFLNKKWLNFSKTQFLTQNCLNLRKTLVSRQNIEKSSLKPKRPFSSYRWCETHF